MMMPSSDCNGVRELVSEGISFSVSNFERVPIADSGSPGVCVGSGKGVVFCTVWPMVLPSRVSVAVAAALLSKVRRESFLSIGIRDEEVFCGHLYGWKRSCVQYCFRGNDLIGG